MSNQELTNLSTSDLKKRHNIVQWLIYLLLFCAIASLIILFITGKKILLFSILMLAFMILLLNLGDSKVKQELQKRNGI